MTKEKTELLVYLISTMYPRVNGLIQRLPKLKAGVEYLICCQMIGDEIIDVELLERTDVKLVVMHELGLTKSRNCLLKKFSEEYINSYAVITDDDVEFLDSSYRDIKLIAKSKNADVITGRVLTPEGHYFKGYSEESFVHTIRTSNVISSIEMVVSSGVVRGGVLFDERFGLGSMYKMGEEGIFIGDLIKKGIKSSFIP